MGTLPSGMPRDEGGIRRARSPDGMPAVVPYRARIGEGSGAECALFDGPSAGDGYPFREPEQFDFIRHVVLPEAMLRRLPGRCFRAWSAACSTGEEAYALAMLLEAEGAASCSTILATDASEGALERARRGLHGSRSPRRPEGERARPLPGEIGGRLEVSDATRRLVRFERLDLSGGGDPPRAEAPSEMDLILCNGVLDDLTPEAARHAAGLLFDALAEGGWLITADGAPSMDRLAPFQAVVTDRGTFYRRGFRGVPPRFLPDPDAREVAPSRTVPPRSPAEVASIGREGEALARVRELAEVDLAAADRACRIATARHPLSCGLHHMPPILLDGMGRRDAAIQSALRGQPRPLLLLRTTDARPRARQGGRRGRGAAGLPQCARPRRGTPERRARPARRGPAGRRPGFPGDRPRRRPRDLPWGSALNSMPWHGGAPSRMRGPRTFARPPPTTRPGCRWAHEPASRRLPIPTPLRAMPARNRTLPPARRPRMTGAAGHPRFDLAEEPGHVARAGGRGQPQPGRRDHPPAGGGESRRGPCPRRRRGPRDAR